MIQRIPKIIFLFIAFDVVACVVVWLSVLYFSYGQQTFLYILRTPSLLPSYTLNAFFSSTPVTKTSTVQRKPAALTSSDSAEVAEYPSPLAIPSKFSIGTMSHAFQKLNNCGPVSASMAASSLGKEFDQFFAADILKGSDKDKNVSPSELVQFLESQGLKATYRVNGGVEQVEQLVAQGIPVIVEQWLVKRGSGELVGHYRVVRGYDQQRQLFTTNDSFNGANFMIPYSQFDEWWRPFHRTYIAVYKPEQEAVVRQILAADWDQQTNWEGALTVAQAEVASIGDGYSHFNLGTAQTHLQQFDAAKISYDRALQEKFPKHFLWYQFTPFETYLQVGEYQKVLDITQDLISHAGDVEEAHYYRGLVFEKQGKIDEAKASLEKAVSANPRFTLAKEKLSELSQ